MQTIPFMCWVSISFHGMLKWEMSTELWSLNVPILLHRPHILHESIQKTRMKKKITEQEKERDTCFIKQDGDYIKNSSQ